MRPVSLATISIKPNEKIALINFGCVRNLSDAEVMLAGLAKKGAVIVDAESAQTLIINTCGFIEDAKKESIDAIVEAAGLKHAGQMQRVIVVGCLSQRYGDVLAKEFPEIDDIYGVLPLEPATTPAHVRLTPDHYAYLKIGEGCYNICSFCAIPQIKGPLVSRSSSSILEELRVLDAAGVKEVNIIGQDTTAYGMDNCGEKRLAGLLRQMAQAVSQVRWLRLLYTFPSYITDELLAVIAAEGTICKYVDVPLQHVSDPVLKAMNRGITMRETYDLIGRIRTQVPKVSLRTAFIIGFPGETDAQFAELLTFIKAMRFEKVGAFMYSPEEGTPAASLPGQLPQKVKRERYDIFMKTQQDISAALQQQAIGTTRMVLIDEESEDARGSAERTYVGRSEYDAPDVDGVVYVHSSRVLMPGDMVSVTITDAYEYDLQGECV